MAKWAVMKSTDCDYEIRAQLCRNFGLLYASQKHFREALEQLSEDVRSMFVQAAAAAASIAAVAAAVKDMITASFDRFTT